MDANKLVAVLEQKLGRLLGEITQKEILLSEAQETIKQLEVALEAKQMVVNTED